MTSADSIVHDYLGRLESELAGVPRAGRREVLDEIKAHIAEGRAWLPEDGEIGVRNLLERLGEPSDIAAEARERFGVKEVHTTWREVGALILLPVGGVALPVIGWLAGVVLLWVSDAWTARDKLVGTLVVPGGLLLPSFLYLKVAAGVTCTRTGPGAQACTGGLLGSHAWAITLVLFLLTALLVADAYLLWRLRRRVRSA